MRVVSGGREREEQVESLSRRRRTDGRMQKQKQKRHQGQQYLSGAWLRMRGGSGYRRQARPGLPLRDTTALAGCDLISLKHVQQQQQQQQQHLAIASKSTSSVSGWCLVCPGSWHWPGCASVGMRRERDLRRIRRGHRHQRIWCKLSGALWSAVGSWRRCPS